MTHLSLQGTAIPELSSSIWTNTKLTSLYLTGCNKLNIVGKKLSDYHGLGSVTELDLSGCTEINASSLWFILDGVQSLTKLKLERCCNLEVIPDNIQNHSMLKWLDLDDCKKLVSLTEIPPSVLYLKAVNCPYLDTYYTQRSLLENMLQTFSKDPPDKDVKAISFLPGQQVPCMFDFQQMETSITILPIPKSDLCWFIFCTILSEGLDFDNYDLHCIIFEQEKEVDRRRISHDYHGTLISDHVLICWHAYDRHESESSDFCNLSFQFILQGCNEKLWWTTEWIKECGILPVYALNHELELNGGSNISELKLKSKAQDTDESNWHLKNVIDELQPTSIEGETRSSKNEDDQEQPSYSRKEEEQLSVSRPPIKHVYAKRRRTK
jgi:hypothetical protein